METRVKDSFFPNSCVWNKDKIDAILPELTPKILSIQASLEGAPDRRIWLKHSSGEYTTKTGYRAALENRAEETENRERVEFQWTKKIWEVSIPPKIKLLIWKAVHGGLPVNERLETRYIIPSAACVKCGEIETIAHVFFTCPFAREEVVTKAIIDAKEWNTAQVKNIPPETAKRGPRMETRFDIICQSDAAWKKKSSTAGTAWKFSGSDEDRSRSNTKIFTLVKSPLVAEGLALRSAMEQAILLDYKQISFETDSKILVTAILEGSHISDLHGILSDIKTLATAFTSISFHWVARNSVSAVDMLAKQALNAFVSNLV
ncbi:uncharacterized protein LOC103864600 [Brassica rapa]|uniref:uncharacterized protein LOC103864600 n=1 Tax=Brassica campestris TaxID=3711 RepID=UPI00142D43BC|nr:uncharacterized protein LOC103864600 [Brassica rapa]